MHTGSLAVSRFSFESSKKSSNSYTAEEEDDIHNGEHCSEEAGLDGDCCRVTWVNTYAFQSSDVLTSDDTIEE